MAPSCSVRAFVGPDEVKAAYLATEVEFTPIGREPFLSRVIHAELDSLRINHAFESGARVKWAAQSPDRAFVRFLTQPGPSVTFNGISTPFGSLVRHGCADDYHEHASGPIHWAAVSLPVEELTAVGWWLADYDLTPPHGPMILTPSPSAMGRLQSLHASVASLVETEPLTIDSVGAAQGLAQSLIEAVVDCLGESHARMSTLAAGCHTTVMRRFRRVLKDNPERPLYLPEICAAIRASERTLRACCHEQLGMGPKQYLMLRRMHLARAALQKMGPRATTVTEIATRFGFWHFGRFAGHYRQLFDEMPSTTLARRCD